LDRFLEGGCRHVAPGAEPEILRLPIPSHEFVQRSSLPDLQQLFAPEPSFKEEADKDVLI
jgi:hypothetical protein